MITKVLALLSLALVISLSQCTGVCWEVALEPIELPFTLNGVCSPSEANYCSNPFEIFFLWTQNSWKSRTFWQPMRYFIFSLNSKVKNPWKSFWQWKNFVFTHTSIIHSYKRSYTSIQSRDLNTKPKKDISQRFFFLNWNPVFMYIFVYYHCNVIKKV